jgi:hypothetical protein
MYSIVKIRMYYEYVRTSEGFKGAELKCAYAARLEAALSSSCTRNFERRKTNRLTASPSRRHVEFTLACPRASPHEWRHRLQRAFAFAPVGSETVGFCRFVVGAFSSLVIVQRTPSTVLRRAFASAKAQSTLNYYCLSDGLAVTAPDAAMALTLKYMGALFPVLASVTVNLSTSP